MLPLWRDEVAIFISPRRIALARRARGLKGRITAATESVVVVPVSSKSNCSLNPGGVGPMTVIVTESV